MTPYPLKHLATYLIKKDFTSDYLTGSGDPFKQGQMIQYIGNTSDINGMMEIIQFKDVTTGKMLFWRTRVENLYDNWSEYLSLV